MAVSAAAAGGEAHACRAPDTMPATMSRTGNPVERPVRSGPRYGGGKPATTADAARYGSAAASVTVAYAGFPLPVSWSSPNPAPPPTTVTTAPDVVDSALAGRRAGSSTVC